MSAARTIRGLVLRIRPGETFTNTRFLKPGLGSRASVDKALSRLVSEGVIQRIIRGVFMRPKVSRFVGTVAPDVRKVVEVMAKDRGETIQVQGAEAASRFRLSTQIPMLPVFYTSEPTRNFQIGNLAVHLRPCQSPEASIGRQETGFGTVGSVVLG